MINEQQRPDLTKIAEDTPKAFRELFVKCWDQNPAKRPEFSDIVDALKAILDVLPA